MPINTAITNNGGNPATVSGLHSFGAVDEELTAHPDVTFWHRRIKQCTNFQIETTTNTFQSEVSFGRTSQFKVPRVPDLVAKAWVVVTLPALSLETFAQDNCSGGHFGRYPVYHEYGVGKEVLYKHSSFLEARAFWIRSAALALVKKATYQIGGQTIDTIYNHYQYIWNELASTPGMRLEEMVGDYDTIDECILASERDQQYFVPLMFSWALDTGNALPLGPLRNHSVEIQIEFEELEKLIAIALPADLPPREDFDGVEDSQNPYLPQHYRVIQKETCCPISPRSLDAVIEMKGIYLASEERNQLANASFEQVVQHLAYQDFTMGCKSYGIRKERLNANHPVTEIMVVVRRKDAEAAGDYFNYDTHDPADEPIRAMQILLNHQQRQAGSGKYYRQLQPHTFHTNSTGKGGVHSENIYVYSFAEDPESPDAAGSLNLSRIDESELVFDFAPDSADTEDGHCCCATDVNDEREVMIFVKFWNVITFHDGLGGLQYSN